MGSRSSGSAVISFGLISIPTKLYLAASSESFSFNTITKRGNRVRQKIVDAITGDEVERSECNKGYEYQKDHFVVLTEDELKAMEGDRLNTIDIHEFVHDHHFNPVQVEKCYYLAPDKGAEKPYRLLGRTLKLMNKIAVGKWYSRGRDHLVALCADDTDALTLFQMYYSNEVRPFEYKFSGQTEPSDKELMLSKKLVAQLESNAFDTSKYADNYAARLREMIDRKLAGDVISAPVAQPEAFVDLAALLESSLRPKPKRKK